MVVSSKSPQQLPNPAKPEPNRCLNFPIQFRRFMFYYATTQKRSRCQNQTQTFDFNNMPLNSLSINNMLRSSKIFVPKRQEFNYVGTNGRGSVAVCVNQPRALAAVCRMAACSISQTGSAVS